MGGDPVLGVPPSRVETLRLSVSGRAPPTHPGPEASPGPLGSCCTQRSHGARAWPGMASLRSPAGLSVGWQVTPEKTLGGREEPVSHPLSPSLEAAARRPERLQAEVPWGSSELGCLPEPCVVGSGQSQGQRDTGRDIRRQRKSETDAQRDGERSREREIGGPRELSAPRGGPQRRGGERGSLGSTPL